MDTYSIHSERERGYWAFRMSAKNAESTLRGLNYEPKTDSVRTPEGVSTVWKDDRGDVCTIVKD
jgi:hypothetical protein